MSKVLALVVGVGRDAVQDDEDRDHETRNRNVEAHDQRVHEEEAPREDADDGVVELVADAHAAVRAVRHGRRRDRRRRAHVATTLLARALPFDVTRLVVGRVVPTIRKASRESRVVDRKASRVARATRAASHIVTDAR